VPRAKWNPEHKFTPAEYEKYHLAPQWQKDHSEFATYTEYEGYWAGVIGAWKSSAKSADGKWKNACQRAIKEVEYVDDSSAVFYNYEKSIAYQTIAIAYAQIQEQVAMLCNNFPQPQITSTQEAENNYVAALNKLMDAEIKANVMDKTVIDVVNDGQYYGLGYFKTSIDYTKYGPMGQKGKICIDRVDPADMYIDPKAKLLSWDFMDYVIQEHNMEIGEIRKLYPIKGFRVPDDYESSNYQSMEEQKAEDTIISPQPKLNKGSSWKRQRVKVLECWFKDARLKFQPLRETKVEMKDREAEFDYKALVLDEDGSVRGKWVPAYPQGRCVIVTEGYVLEDMPNRFPHGKCPFIFTSFAPSTNLFVPGDATRVTTLAQRINDIITRVHAYAQSEVERPMHGELGVFPNPKMWARVPNKSDRILPVNPGKIFERPQPVEVPQFTWTLLQWYQQMLDMISGSSTVMRGNITDGAQLSAEALQSLQTFASSRLALKAKMLASAMKELGYQLMWLIRMTYNENIQVQVTQADGSPLAFDWNSDKNVFESGDEDDIAQIMSKEGYLVDIKAGTGTPNAMQAQQEAANQLYDRNALDQTALLDAYQYPGRQGIIQRMANQKPQDIAAAAMGKEFGTNVKEFEKTRRPGAPKKVT
jgi:hypothetical protein